MNWKRLVGERRLEERPAHRQEIDGIRRAVAWILEDLETALRSGLSPERCYGIAYDAARMIAVQAVRCSGYRVLAGNGAHYYTFQAFRLAVGDVADDYATYFDHCRGKRNEVCYDWGGVSGAEARELAERVVAARALVEGWILVEYPELAASGAG